MPDKPILFGVCFIIFIFLLNFLNPHLFSGIAQKIGSPFFAFGDSVRNSIYNISNNFKSKNTLILENKFLITKNLALETKLLNYELIVQENKKLKEITNKNKSENFISGNIISWPPSSPYDTLVLDAGKKQGIENRDKVFYENVMIGEIYDVSENTSSAYLFSTNGTKIDAILNEKTPIVINGIGGGNFVSELSKDIDIKIGDIITTLGSSTGIIGVVEYIEVKTSDASQKVFFRSPFNILEVRNVEVLRLF